jgi:co-chaperonin GroES (HSP10)
MLQAENKHYVIEACGQTKQTAGGIIISASEDTELAKILSAGPEIKDPIPVGTQVAVNWGSVVAVTLQGRRVFVIHADHILASVPGAEE